MIVFRKTHDYKKKNALLKAKIRKLERLLEQATPYRANGLDGPDDLNGLNGLNDPDGLDGSETTTIATATATATAIATTTIVIIKAAASPASAAWAAKNKT